MLMEFTAYTRLPFNIVVCAHQTWSGVMVKRIILRFNKCTLKLLYLHAVYIFRCQIRTANIFGRLPPPPHPRLGTLHGVFVVGRSAKTVRKLEQFS